MNKYKMNDLKKITDVENLIRSNLHQYINNSQEPSYEIVTNLVADALALSVCNVAVTRVKNWYLVSSDINWCQINIEKNQDVFDIFNRLMAIPERGDNSFRGEILVNIFSQDCFVFDDGDILVIKGEHPQEGLINALPSNHIFAICFRNINIQS